MKKRVLLVAAAGLICSGFLCSVFGQEPGITNLKGPGTVSAAAEKVKTAGGDKAPAEKISGPDAGAQEREKKIEEKLKKHKAELEAKVEKERKHISGFLTQLKSPRSILRSKALYAIYGAHKEGKISKRTAILIFLEAGKDTFPVVSTTAFTKLRETAGETIPNELEAWTAWWEKTEKKREEDLRKKFEEELKTSEEGKDEEAAEPAEEEEEDKETEEERKARLLEEGKKKLMQEHNRELGYIDRLFLKNGRELTGYIIREDRDEKGKTVRYIIKFKGALGRMIVPASDVEGKPRYDIDKKKRGVMPLPVPVEEKP